MGKINQGILGSVSGKVGGVIGGSWKGIGYVRSIPASVADRKSTAQLEQRAKMKLLGKVSAEILAEIIKPLWDRFAIKMSGYNAFVRKNMPAFLSGSVISLESLVISNGKMAATPNVSASWNSGSEELSIFWDNDMPDSFASASDKMYILVIDNTGLIYATVSGTVARIAGETVLSLADMSFNPKISGVYVAAARVDGTIVSASAFTVPA